LIFLPQLFFSCEDPVQQEKMFRKLISPHVNQTQYPSSATLPSKIKAKPSSFSSAAALLPTSTKVSLTDYIKGSRMMAAGKGKRRSSSPVVSPDFHWSSTVEDSGDIDEDSGHFESRHRSLAKPETSTTSSSTIIFTTMFVLCLLFSSVDNDLFPTFISDIAEEIIYPERFLTPRSSFRFFKVPHFAMIAILTYVLVTFMYSVVSTISHSSIVSSLSMSLMKIFSLPKERLIHSHRAWLPLRLHSSELANSSVSDEDTVSTDGGKSSNKSSVNKISDEGDGNSQICSDCGLPLEMHEDDFWGGKTEEEREEESEIEMKDFARLKDTMTDDDIDEKKTISTMKRTRANIASLASHHFPSKFNNPNFGDDERDGLDNDNDTNRSSSVPSLRRSSRMHHSPERFE
jgi:hypothetical protein